MNALDSSVDILILKPRTRARLRYARIWTLRDLVAQSELDIRDIPWTGNKTILDIKIALAKLGLKLREEG